MAFRFFFYIHEMKIGRLAVVSEQLYSITQEGTPSYLCTYILSQPWSGGSTDVDYRRLSVQCIEPISAIFVVFTTECKTTDS